MGVRSLIFLSRRLLLKYLPWRGTCLAGQFTRLGKYLAKNRPSAPFYVITDILLYVKAVKTKDLSEK